MPVNPSRHLSKSIPLNKRYSSLLKLPIAEIDLDHERYKQIMEKIWTPERKLLYALIERAILDIAYADIKHTSCSRLEAAFHARDALRWIQSSAKSKINDYERICEVLNINPMHLRDPEKLRNICAYYREHKTHSSR